jgi:hypothetical protein
LEAANICVPSAKFPWLGWLLSKVHSELLQIAKLIIELLKKVNKYIWIDACDETFKILKKLFTTRPALAQPDITKPFNGLGGVLMQEGGVMSYSSQQLRCHEEHYMVTLYTLVTLMILS